MQEQEIRESNFLIYRWAVNPLLPEEKRLPECLRCEGWGFTDADRKQDKHFGRCNPCFGTGLVYPGDEIVTAALSNAA